MKKKLILVSVMVWALGFSISQAEAPAASGGTIQGVVKLVGTPPPVQPLKRQADPFCAKTSANDETVVVGAAGGLKYSVVRIKGPIAGAQPGAKSVVFDQSNCLYSPRVTALGPKQILQVRNTDPVLHNVHCYNGTTTCFNRAQMKGAKDIEQTLAPGVYKMKCDVHPWMTGWVVVNENDFVAVTDGNGGFSIPNVPAGTYTLEAWHEKYGVQTASVTVTTGGASTNFSFNAP